MCTPIEREMFGFLEVVREKFACINLYFEDTVLNEIASEYGKDNHTCFLKYSSGKLYKKTDGSYGLNCILWSMAMAENNYTIKYLIKVENQRDRERNTHLRFYGNGYTEDKSRKGSPITQESGEYSDYVYCLSGERKVFCFKDSIEQTIVEGDFYFMVVIIDDNNKIVDLSEVRLSISDAISYLEHSKEDVKDIDIVIENIDANEKFIGSDFYVIRNFE